MVDPGRVVYLFNFFQIFQTNNLVAFSIDNISMKIVTLKNKQF